MKRVIFMFKVKGRISKIVDCHFHVDETMLTLEKMIEGMDKNDGTKTALISPMNETMFELNSTFQHNLQSFFRFLILHAPQIGLLFHFDETNAANILYFHRNKVVAYPYYLGHARAVERVLARM